MNIVEDHGREVLVFQTPDKNGNPYQGSVGVNGINVDWDNPALIVSIHLSATYHGDRDEFWILAKLDNGTEQRFNLKSIDYFHLGG